MKRIGMLMIGLMVGVTIITYEFGAWAGFEGTYNTFYGDYAGDNTDNDIARWDTFMGRSAGQLNTTGSNNTFVGGFSGQSNTTGSENTFLGGSAGQANNEGYENTFLGMFAGNHNTSGYYNTFVGKDAGNSNIQGNSNTFVGYKAGYSSYGNDNTFVGRNAGHFNTTGYYNTFIGLQAGYNNISGQHNTALGRNAGFNNTEGTQNTFIGQNSGFNATGSGNVFLGINAGYNEAGSDKLYIANSNTDTPLIYGEFDNKILTINGNLEVIGPDNGLVRLSNVTTDNTGKGARMVLNHYSNLEKPVYLFGAFSGPADNFVAFGGGNTIGNAATQIDLFTAENNVTAVGSPRITVKGNGYIGLGTQAPSYPLQMAGGAYSNGGSWVNGSSREFKDNIRDLKTEDAVETLKGLNPVTFTYKASPGEGHVGFIAEDVPDLVATKDRKGLSPMDIVAVLTKVVQELKARNEMLEQRVLALEGKGK